MITPRCESINPIAVIIRKMGTIAAVPVTTEENRNEDICR